MTDVWRDFLIAAFFVASFVFNLWAGKTHLFPWATYDREEEFQGFWMTQGLLIVCAIVGFGLGVKAAFGT